ncbi:MAG: ester cyclase [Gammaproteobacteria bacterium]|nr:ester cyclase [Gammaproteobacteria bacterium]
MSSLPIKSVLRSKTAAAIAGALLTMGLLTTGCASNAASTDAMPKAEMAHMTAEQNRKVFHRVIDEGLNAHSTKVLDEVVAANFVDHTLPPETPPGPAALKQFFTYFWTAFPDIQFTFEDEVVEGNKIAGRGYFTGTHKGEFQGIAPTGKKIKVAFMDEWRFENGKWVEYWGQFDSASLMQQLGVMPKTAAK